MKTERTVSACDICRTETLDADDLKTCLFCGQEVCRGCREELHVGEPTIHRYSFMYSATQKRDIHIAVGYVCHKCAHQAPRILEGLAPINTLVPQRKASRR